jgi:hypothetical protein
VSLCVFRAPLHPVQTYDGIDKIMENQRDYKREIAGPQTNELFYFRELTCLNSNLFFLAEYSTNRI